MAATLWQSEDEAVWESHLDAIEQRMRASGKTTKYGSLKAKLQRSTQTFRRAAAPRNARTCTTQALHKKWTNLQGQSELSKDDLVLVVGYKLTRGKMRPLMRFAEAMHDNEVRKASKAAIAAIPDARKACDALTALTGIGVAAASVCLAAVDDRLPVMSDEAGGGPRRAGAREEVRPRFLSETAGGPALRKPRSSGLVDAARRRGGALLRVPRAARRQTQARRLERLHWCRDAKCPQVGEEVRIN